MMTKNLSLTNQTLTETPSLVRHTKIGTPAGVRRVKQRIVHVNNFLKGSIKSRVRRVQVYGVVNR
jgi:hypothetical protein